MTPMADTARALAHERTVAHRILGYGDCKIVDGELSIHSLLCNAITTALRTARNETLEEIAAFADSMAEDERLLAKSARRPMLEVERTGKAAAAEAIAKRCRTLKDCT